MNGSRRVTAVCTTFRRNVLEGDGGLARPDAPEMLCRDEDCPIHGRRCALAAQREQGCFDVICDTCQEDWNALRAEAAKWKAEAERLAAEVEWLKKERKRRIETDIESGRRFDVLQSELAALKALHAKCVKVKP